MILKSLVIDLFCGLGGWADGFLAGGYDVVGFDIERHDYGSGGYPGQLVIQDVLTLHGSQFRDATVIVASPPCTEYSYMAMPWSRAKHIAGALREEVPFPEGYKGSRTLAELNALFNACFRIQREACEASVCPACDGNRTIEVRPAGYGHSDDLAEHEWCDICKGSGKRYIPLVVENVKGAQPWVGKAKANYGSFYLWGDIGMVGNRIVSTAPKFGGGLAAPRRAGGKANPDGSENGTGSWFGKGARFTSRDCGIEAVDTTGDGTKYHISGHDWYRNPLHGGKSSKSNARKAASAAIAKIPYSLARHIAELYYPEKCIQSPLYLNASR
jgi:hypothetical protein